MLYSLENKLRKISKLLLTLMILSFSISCSSDDDDAVNPKNLDSYHYYQNSKLELIQQEENNLDATIIEGEKLVFQYYFSTEGEPEIADDELEEFVLFEIDPASTDFELNSDSFSSHHAVIGQFCFCGKTGYFEISSGTIKGEKISDDTWLVHFDVTAIVPLNGAAEDFEIHINKSGKFTPAS